MYKVLVVEDERWVRIALREVLAQTGLPFEIVKDCTNGLEALEWLKQNDADIVFADFKMPVMDGLAFSRQLNEMSHAPSVIFITGHDDFEVARQALRCGVIDYLLKPVEADEMHVCLSKWIASVAKRKEPIPVAPVVGTIGSEPLTTIEQVIKLIHESPPSEVSLAEVAAKVHINPSYLSQLFKQHTGQRFTDYVVGLRMEEAKMLVVRTSLRISEIAERLGYSDIAYFSNAFKKHTGQTPLEFRKSQLKSTRASF